MVGLMALSLAGKMVDKMVVDWDQMMVKMKVCSQVVKKDDQVVGVMANESVAKRVVCLDGEKAKRKAV